MTEKICEHKAITHAIYCCGFNTICRQCGKLLPPENPTKKDLLFMELYAIWQSEVEQRLTVHSLKGWLMAGAGFNPQKYEA